MQPSNHRLLILSCSRGKRNSARILPAIERYDGPAFRVVRRYLATTQDAPTICILSAEYGLLLADSPVPYYDRAMDADRARVLRPLVARQLATIATPPRFRSVFLILGSAYRSALGDAPRLFADAQVLSASGPPGVRLAQLRRWLVGDRDSVPVGTEPAVPATFKGRSVSCAARDVLEMARVRLPTVEPAHYAPNAWYVDVYGVRVSPKWLVGMFTGLKSSQFHTDEARRLLGGLGIHVAPT